MKALLAYLAVALLYAMVVGMIQPLLGMDSRFDYAGVLEPCESKETEAGCWQMDGRVYLNMAPDLRAESNMKSLVGRRVLLTIAPQ